jgi:hypothetical protein
MSVFGLVTSYGRDGIGIESRLKAGFSALVQTSHKVHLTYCKIGTGSLSWEQSGRGVALTTHPI